MSEEMEEMSDIRQDLERCYQMLEEKKAQEEKAETDSTEEPTAVTEDDEDLQAPAGYKKEFAETFKDLPREWREYLRIREQEIEKGFSDLQLKGGSHKLLQDAYEAKLSELQHKGVNSADDWLKFMLEIDKNLSDNPTVALKKLAEAYNVNFGSATPSATPRSPQQLLSDAMAAELVNNYVSSFRDAVDEKGNQKHPFFGEVNRTMHELISKGIATSLEDAYKTAIWVNISTREKLIAQRSQEALELKSRNAQKSKQAAFAPKSKAVEPEKELSLREELERNYKLLGYPDDDDE